MAIDTATTVAAMRANIKAAMSAAYSQPEATYEQFAGIIADAIGIALEHVRTDADVSGVTAGSDTVVGGVE